MASHVYALMLGGPRGLSKLVISRVMIGVNTFRVPISLLITYLLSPLGLQAPQTQTPLTPKEPCKGTLSPLRLKVLYLLGGVGGLSK